MDDRDPLDGAGIPARVLEGFRPVMKPGATLYLGRDESRLQSFEELAAGADFDAVLFHPADVVEFHGAEPEKSAAGNAPTVGSPAASDQGSGYGSPAEGHKPADGVEDDFGDDPENDFGGQDNFDDDAADGDSAGGKDGDSSGGRDDAAVGDSDPDKDDDGPRRTVLRWPRDRGSIRLPGLRYDAVFLDGVLSGMSPAAGDRTIEQVRGAVRPGGLVFASALASGDPVLAQLEAASEPVARGTFELGEGELVRFVARGELAMAFAGWMLLHASEGGLTAGLGQDARSSSVVVARRPAGGTLLA